MLRDDRAAGKEIVDLAHTSPGDPRVGKSIEKSLPRRLNGVIPPPGSPPESRPCRALERPGDDPRDIVRRHQHFTGDLARAVELLDGNHAFVRGDLKNRISRG